MRSTSLRRWALLLALVILAPQVTGCATSQARRKHRAQLQSVLDQGLMLLGQSRVRVGKTPFRSDCSGFVEACYSRAKIDLIDPMAGSGSATATMFRTLKKRQLPVRRKRAQPGDLAFFHNTHDRNGNGLRDDRFTHVALVEKVERDGTVHFMHFAGGTVKRGVLNVKNRKQHLDPYSGKTWNSHLRQGRGRTLAGQLLFRFGQPLPPP